MQIEEKVFQRRRFVPEAMERFGFRKTENGYEYETDFLDGDFHVRLLVTEQGAVRGCVTDRMNGEEYAPLRMDRFNGAYVNSVRGAYEDLLNGIGDRCCREVLFASDQANRITALIWDRYGVEPDFPWDEDPYEPYGVFRHAENRKWFALLMSVKWNALLRDGRQEHVDLINLKIDPAQSEALCKRPGVYPAYHMNHQNWISVTLNDQLPDGDVMTLVDQSFQLTAGKAKR